ELQLLSQSPGRQGRANGLVRLAEQRMTDGLECHEPCAEPGLARDRRLGALQQVKVLATSYGVTRKQQVSRQGEQTVGCLGEYRGADPAQVQRCWHDRVG